MSLRSTSDPGRGRRHRSHLPRRVPALLLVFALLAVVTGCAKTGSGSATGGTDVLSNPNALCTVPTNTVAGPTSGPPTGTIQVLAAASLEGAFFDLAVQFEHTYPGTKVDLSFGASSTLVAQVHQGSPADVLATADTATMGQALKDGDVQTPLTFACNRMAILVAKGNPKHIQSLADLGRSGVRYVLCAAPVPCGRLGREVLARAGVDAKPVGSEQDVKTVVAKVEAGEVDAGIVYVTDAKAAAGKADGVAIPASQNVVTAYPIAVTNESKAKATASAFVAFVASKQGEAALARFGFTTS